MSKKIGYLEVLLNYLPQDFEGVKKPREPLEFEIFLPGG